MTNNTTDKKEEEKEIALGFFDGEASGCEHLKHGLLAIGVVIGTTGGKVIAKKQFNILLPEDKCFEQKCYDEFWSKNLHILELLKEGAKEPKEAMTDFINFIDEIEDKYNLVIISDNPVFDIGFINYYLGVYLNRKPLSYDHNNNYRPIFDTDSYSRGVMGMDYSNLWTSDADIAKELQIDRSTFVKHNHCPMDDAHYIYQMHTSVVNTISSLNNDVNENNSDSIKNSLLSKLYRYPLTSVSVFTASVFASGFGMGLLYNMFK